MTIFMLRDEEREVIGRFGSTLAILDFDGDNLLDIGTWFHTLDFPGTWTNCP